MGMFGDLMNKIFHATSKAEAPPDAAKPGVPLESRVEAAHRQGVPVAMATPGAPAAAGAPASAMSGPATVMTGVDVTSILDKMASENKEKLDWKHSIVDLMKLVGMDSSLAARRELAADLKYTGDTADTATMNIWLHKEVMRKLAENGGKVPAELQ